MEHVVVVYTSIKKTKSMIFNFGTFDKSLKISKDLQYVEYDGYTYQVNEVVRVSKHQSPVYHHCYNLEYRVEFEWTATLDGQDYAVHFCNRCKTLIIKEL